jgi:hypothetical protein
LTATKSRPRRPSLILAHQARVADDVRGEDRGEAVGRGYCSGTPALRMPSKTGSSPARYVGSLLIAVHGFDHAAELDEAAFAGALDDAPVMGGEALS